VQDVADLAEVLLAVVVGDLEHRALRALDELARLAVVAVDRRLDLVGRREEPAQERALLDDVAVAAHGADARRHGGQRVDLGLAARLLELAARAQVLGDREDVDRLARREQRDDRGEDRAMALAVEVVLPQALFDDVGVVRAVRLQDRAEDGLLGLDRVRRDGAGRRAGGRGVGGGGAHRGCLRVNRALRPDAGADPGNRASFVAALRRVGTVSG